MLTMSLAPARHRLARHVIPVMLALLCAWTLPAYYGRFQPDVRELANRMKEIIPPGAPIVFASEPPHEPHAREAYLALQHYIQPFPWPIVILNHPADQQLIAQLARGGGIWYIEGWSETQRAQLVPGYEVHTRGDTRFAEQFGGVGTLMYLTPRSSPATSP
jgi:hypothetical protein